MFSSIIRKTNISILIIIKCVSFMIIASFGILHQQRTTYLFILLRAEVIVTNNNTVKSRKVKVFEQKASIILLSVHVQIAVIMSDFHYHMEAFRKQRVIERKHGAEVRLNKYRSRWFLVIRNVRQCIR